MVYFRSPVCYLWKKSKVIYYGTLFLHGHPFNNTAIDFALLLRGDLMKVLMIDDQKKPFWFANKVKPELEGITGEVEITLATTFEDGFNHLKNQRWFAWMLDYELDQKHTGLELLNLYIEWGFFPPKIIYGISSSPEYNREIFNRIQEIKEKDDRWLTTEFILLRSRY